MGLEFTQKLLRHLAVVAKLQLLPSHGLQLFPLSHAEAFVHQLRQLVQQHLWLDEHQVGQDGGEVEQHVEAVEEVQSFLTRLVVDLHRLCHLPALLSRQHLLPQITHHLQQPLVHSVPSYWCFHRLPPLVLAQALTNGLPTLPVFVIWICGIHGEDEILSLLVAVDQLLFELR